MNLENRGWVGFGSIIAVTLMVVVGGSFFLRNGVSSDLKIDAPLAVVATPGAKTAITFPAGDAQTPPVSGTTPTPLPTPTIFMVHVAGQVKKPGVYSLKPGDRVIKAIEAAGGFLPDADIDSLNLADYVRDADKCFVGRKPTTPAAITMAAAAPTVVVHSNRSPLNDAVKIPPPGRVLGSKASVTSPASHSAEETSPEAHPAASHPAKLKNPGDGIINLNTADLAELQRLPGVGPSTAEKILEKRKEIGSFADISQLQDVKGIGPKKFAKMEPFLRVK